VCPTGRETGPATGKIVESDRVGRCVNISWTRFNECVRNVDKSSRFAYHSVVKYSAWRLCTYTCLLRLESLKLFDVGFKDYFRLKKKKKTNDLIILTYSCIILKLNDTVCSFPNPSQIFEWFFFIYYYLFFFSFNAKNDDWFLKFV